MTHTKTVSDQLQERFPDVKWNKLTPPESHPHWKYPGFAPNTITVLPAGHKKEPKYRAFAVPTVFERDICVTMRDGTKLYTDIFRPEGDFKVPALIAWSPYSKVGGPQQYETMGPFNCGVDMATISGYQKFEAPDPADWTERGYAVINIDARGCAYSEGDTTWWGEQEAEDIYDTITWLSEQPWCNGSVVMAGNSWLSVCQLNFASRFTHPALKAIAPWEGLTDVYNDIIMRGGFPYIASFNDFISTGFAGFGKVENVPGVRAGRPLYDEYWESKRSHVENIDTPMYQTASYSSQLHTRGSFEAFERAKTTKKWIRVHPYQEWHDQYRLDMNDDLQKFFDFYAKGIDNGWEKDTPRVRLSLLGFDGSDEPSVVERPHEAYPVPGTTSVTYHLDAATHTLNAEAPKTVSTTEYEAHSTTASSDFTLKFDRRTELAGYGKAKVWVSCADKDDMDVVVQLRKLDRDGNLLMHLNYPIPIPYTEFTEHSNISTTLGPQAMLRASHAVSRDDSLSRHENQVVYKHDKREPVPPGTIVPLEMTFWPMGMVFGAGEQLMLRVSGRHMALPEILFMASDEPEDENIGKHVLHTGGKYDSVVVLPVLPEYK